MARGVQTIYTYSQLFSALPSAACKTRISVFHSSSTFKAFSVENLSRALACNEKDESSGMSNLLVLYP